MTDKEKLIALLTEFGIVFETVKDNAQNPDGDIILIKEEGDNPKVDGYSGFFTDFFFDPMGKFVKMGIVE